ncbi:HNH endonuclease [Pseudopedobacter beijingensis]|uniref:HNH endonuclease n=1 Tax=Pseudopedobacter beijingensis TaxID=1207056 RepID=UPI0036D24E09
MRLSSTYGHHFIDACHIIPFSLTHDDRITNGIALCPNMHRAFDRGYRYSTPYHCFKKYYRRR